jgi:hypothetical protein
MADTGPRVTRAQAAAMLGIPLARLHSLERIGVCAPDESRTYGDTHPALYDWRTVCLVGVVIQAEAFGIRGQQLASLANGIQLRLHLLRPEWRGWVVWDHRGPVDLVEQVRSEPSQSGQVLGLPNLISSVPLLLIPLDCPALLGQGPGRP